MNTKPNPGAVMPVNRPMDFEQRLQALDPDNSFLCEAPAGSGKTELLTQRFLTLLSRVARPEELLAITFTRKATAEMRDRIIGSLASARQAPEPENEYQRITWHAAGKVLDADRKSGWDLLNNPGRLQIRTFDSLCSFLSRALPVHSTFGAPPEITDEPEMLYRQAVHELFQDLEQDVPWSQSLSSVLRHLDNNFQGVEELLISMLQRREEWLPLLDHGAPAEMIRDRLETHLQHVPDDVIAKLKVLIPGPHQSEIIELSRFAAANLQATEYDSGIKQCAELDIDSSRLPDSSEQGICQWLGILELLTTREGQWRTALNKRIGFPPGESRQEKELFRQQKERMSSLIDSLKQIDGLLDALHDLRMLPAVHYNDQQLEVLEAITQVLPVLVARLTVIFSERNCVDYTEVGIRARSALGGLESPSDLALALDYSIRHILVDEFQDVSSAQVSLLRQLTGGWQPGDGHTIFCVGDAMQSIYGFRDAKVGLFIHCEEHGLGNIPLTCLRLKTNFRARQGLVNWINAVFEPVFPGQNDISSGAVKYSSSEAYHGELPGRSAIVYGIEGHGYQAREAQAILDIIRQTRSETPDSTIAILVRNRSHAAHITALLRTAKLNYRAVDLEPLSQHAVILDLMSLCHAMLHPADRISWLSVLRAPWCGLDLADLLAVAGFNGSSVSTEQTLVELIQACLSPETADDSSPRPLSAEGKTRLARVAGVLLQALDTRHRKPLRQWVEGTWLELGGPACMEEPADLDNAERFFSLLESIEASGTLPDWDSLRRGVTGLYAAPDPAGSENLQIMTIHKAKGLEFDIVIVPSLHRRQRGSTSELVLWQERLTTEGRQELIMAPIPASGGDRDRTYRYLLEERRKKESFEACRLLYVACTRAKRKLYLVTEISPQEQGVAQYKVPAKSSLLYTIWNTVQQRIEPVDVSDGSIDTIPADPITRYIRRLPADWRLPEFSGRHLLTAVKTMEEQGYPGDEFEDAEAGLETDATGGVWVDPTARHVGTVVHRILQEIGRQGLAQWDDVRIEQARPFYRARLATLGVSSTNIESAVTEVIEYAKGVLQDRNFRWMYSDGHTVRYCEYPVTVRARHSYRNLVIDLLIQAQDGSTWIIDYKTGRPDKNQSMEEYLETRKHLNSKKMELYRYAVHQLGYENIKPALYFPMMKKWVEY